MDRIYESLVTKNLFRYPQMAFLVGPRQVGKTTIARSIQARFKESVYLNFDNVEDRTKILEGQTFIERLFPRNVLRDAPPLVIFDEIHKHRDWKNYLKGFYDLYKDAYKIIVTGSMSLDIYQSGGDSLMGRYFLYRIHPLSVAELISRERGSSEIFAPPRPLPENRFSDIYAYGGFPDPYFRADPQYFTLWQSTRCKQLLHEEIRSLAHLQEIHLLENLAEILKSHSGGLLNQTSLAKKIGVTTQTISRWINILDRFYYSFTVRPWFKNVTRSLTKEPKIYLWDWSLVVDEGRRIENFIASHLLKFAHFCSDTGMGTFALYYLRTVDKKEVDFLLTKNDVPFLMVEAKAGEKSLSSAIKDFSNQIDPEFAVQAVFKADFLQKSCFSGKTPLVVPAKTLLSQLV